MKISILVNTSANNGAAANKWKLFRSNLGVFDAHELRIKEYSVPFDLKQYLLHLVNDLNIKVFISAGGDGSVNFLLNHLLDIVGNSIAEFTIGGIGLGSSNDFVKPFGRLLSRIASRIDFHSIMPHDIGLVKYTDQFGVRKQRYFIINSSVGLLAQANYVFNKGDVVIDNLKSKYLSFVINYTALKTIVKFKSSQVVITSDFDKKTVNLTCLSVLKNPHVSGDFKYNQVIPPASGSFGVNYCFDLNLFGILGAMSDLKNNRFITGYPVANRSSFFSKCLHVSSTAQSQLFLEMDGEAVVASNISYSIHSYRINVLGVY